MLDQIRALVWLKYIIFKRTLFKGHLASTVVFALVTPLLVLLCIAVGIGAFFIGRELVEPGEARHILIVMDVFLGIVLLFWMVGLLSELQRSETVDFRKMLYLPVSLKAVFALNFAVSLLSPMLFFFAFGILGLLLGLTVNFGPIVWLGLPLSVLFYLCLSSWTYYVRGMLNILMANKRRRRAILLALSLLFILVFQLPYFLSLMQSRGEDRTYMSHEYPFTVDEDESAEVTELRRQRYHTRKEQESQSTQWLLATGNQLVPLGWLPYGMYALLDGKAGAFSLCFLGIGSLGSLALGLGFRSTWRFYHGAASRRIEKEKKRKDEMLPSRISAKEGLIMKELPVVGPDTSAVAMASFLSYVRHPRTRICVLMTIIFGIIFAGAYAPTDIENVPGFARTLIPAGLVAWVMVSFLQFICNVFGMDRDGFRMFILLPTPRKKFLLGKNLGLFPIIAVLSVLFVVVGGVVLKISLISGLVALMNVCVLYIFLCIAGNVFSIYFPYYVPPETMRAGSGKGVAFLGMLLFMILMPFLMLPTIFCLFLDEIVFFITGCRFMIFGLLGSMACLALAVYGYRISLTQTGRLLQGREIVLLDKLLRDRE
ncbi:hypothetical protein ACFL1X_04045 [Candidatus Hydrogenedentota bacterium]